MELLDTLLFFAASVLNVIDAVQTSRFFRTGFASYPMFLLQYLPATNPRLAFLIETIGISGIFLTVLLLGLRVFRASCPCGIEILALAIAFNNLQLQ